MENAKKTFFQLFDLLKRVCTSKAMGYLLLFFLFFSLLYHNDKTYRYFEDQINPHLTKSLGDDPLLWLNTKLHKVDLKGKILALANPLEKDDYIDIQITDNEQEKLNKFLTFSPVKKKWVNIALIVNGKSIPAKLKYHGTDTAHFANNKFSYSIKLKNGAPYFNHFRKFKLIKGEQADAMIANCNALALSQGLISTVGSMKILRINGESRGDYYFVEDIKKEVLERQFGITHYSTIEQTSDWSRKETIHISAFDFFEGHIQKDKDSLHAKALFQFKQFCDFIKKKDLESIKEKIDISYLGKYLAVASIFNDIHFMSGDNLKWIYDFDRAKFYPIYRAETLGRPIDKSFSPRFENYNQLLFQAYGKQYLNNLTSQFFKLLLSDNAIREQRDKALLLLIRNKEKILSDFERNYHVNQKVSYRSGRSRRIYDLQYIKQKEIVGSLFSMANQYLNYGHVYGSFDKHSGSLRFVVDAFVPFTVLSKDAAINLKHVRGIEFNAQLRQKNNFLNQVIKTNNFKPKDLLFINEITGDTLLDHIYFNTIDSSDKAPKLNTLQSLNNNKIKYKLSGKQLLIAPGTYVLKSSITIDSDYSTVIPKGVKLLLAKDVNLQILGDISIEGTKENKVVIQNLEPTIPFGTFSVIGQKQRAKVEIDYLVVSGGSQSMYNGQLFSGQFVVCNSQVAIRNSFFENSSGDDGLNIKFSKVALRNCHFSNNKADQLDLDFCAAKLVNCTFISAQKDSNGDGVDLSGSDVYINACRFELFKDKGLSVGEKSKALIDACVFLRNKNAIAVKDEGVIYMLKNIFTSNQIDVTSFIKKPFFDAPVIYIHENTEKLRIQEKKNIQFVSEKEMKTKEKRFLEFLEKRIKNTSSSLLVK